ncbi:DNA repair protein RAD51 4 [Thelohanellus kitauei]|uniref:DNA repair protein RAD51 4 n=1 Tax=Thelohanellus kitauei TaxID=669202 RepID=A0A0C2MZV9_THEKT|nr:DNA repair protein RAD51 4 [Thelohanellus kitauei]
MCRIDDKSPMCYDIVKNAAKRNETSIVFDTSNAFRSSPEVWNPSYLSCIRFFNLGDVTDIFGILYYLDACIKNDKPFYSRLRYIIFDNFALISSPLVFGPKGSIKVLHEIGLCIKKFSFTNKICAIATNIITIDAEGVRPALGSLWGTIPHEKLMLSIVNRTPERKVPSRGN